MAAKDPGTVVPVNGSNTLSSSRYLIETANGSCHFTVNGYSLAKGMGAGKYVASELFSAGGYDWAIYFYPDGKNPEDDSLYISVFIVLESEDIDVRVLFELTLLDQSGKGKHKIHSHFDRSLESGPYTLKHKGSMWGYNRFYRRHALETSYFLRNDSLAITCTVGVVVSSLQSPKPTLPVPELALGQHFLETVNGSHHFTIDGYSLAKGMGVGKYLASELFSVGGYEWAIYFYPDGKDAEDDALYISVFIALASEGGHGRAFFELILLDQSGKGKHKVYSHFDCTLESGPCTLTDTGSMWGFKRFYKRRILETTDFLKNDSLAITCTVGVVV